MTSSTDSLKKKVCVTVFLDELFEEVEEEERREPIQVSEVTESVAKVAEKPFREPSRVDLGNDERVNVSPNADTEQNQVQVRPRKHRRESKFSKNRYDSFKNELTKYGCRSRVQLENGGRERPDSTPSDSDFDLDDFLELDKWPLDKSRTSFTQYSGHDFAADSFLSNTPVLSSTAILRPTPRNPSRKTFRNVSRPHMQSPPNYCHKSTQFDSPPVAQNNSPLDIPIQPSQPHHIAPPRDNSTSRVQIILTETDDKTDSCEGDTLRLYRIRSLLEECLKRRGSARSTEGNESNLQASSASYTCVVTEMPGNPTKTTPEVHKVWANSKNASWNDGFESDLSEVDCGKENGLQVTPKESLVCYTLRVECNDSNFSQRTKGKNEASRSSSRSSCRAAASRKTSLLLQAMAQLSDGSLLDSLLKEQKTSKEECGGVAVGAVVEGISKNYAEGDTISGSVGRGSGLILDLDAKEKLFVCDEILKRVGESKVIRNDIIVNRAEIEVVPQEKAEIRQSPTGKEVFAEILFNQTESLEKDDAESELVFAESENFCESEDFFRSKYSVGPGSSLPLVGNVMGKDVCVVEFEDKLSRSKMLRRMKTVEILGDSLNDMKNISTEVILICENMSNNEVCLEAWQSSNGTLRSLSEMKQCYLKDSRDSAMYLIEIPLHFIRPKKSNSFESEHFFKPSDSD